MKTVMWVTALVVAVAATAFATNYVNQQRLGDVVEQANRAAEAFGVQPNELAGTAEARAKQVLNQQEIIEALEDENGYLLSDLRRADVQALHLNRTIASLNQRLEGEAQGEREGEEVRASISDTARYERGSELAVTGTFLLNTETLLADYQLDVTGELFVGTTVSRLPSNELRVDVWSDAPLTFHTIDVVNNINDPIHDRTRSGFLDGILDTGSVPVAIGAFLLGMAVK